MENIETFESLSNEQLKLGVELLVSPEELCEREVLISILQKLDFRPQDVLEQIKAGEPLNAGPVLNLSDCAGFNTTTKRKSVA